MSQQPKCMFCFLLMMLLVLQWDFLARYSFLSTCICFAQLSRNNSVFPCLLYTAKSQCKSNNVIVFIHSMYLWFNIDLNGPSWKDKHAQTLSDETSGLRYVVVTTPIQQRDTTVMRQCLSPPHNTCYIVWMTRPVVTCRICRFQTGNPSNLFSLL